jgi:hypothetical protein
MHSRQAEGARQSNDWNQPTSGGARAYEPVLVRETNRASVAEWKAGIPAMTGTGALVAGGRIVDPTSCSVRQIGQDS